MNNIMIPIHTNSNHYNRLQNNFLYPKSKKIIIENRYNKLEVSKTGTFKRTLTIVAVNTNYTYTNTEKLVYPQIVVERTNPTRFKVCVHPQKLLYRDERGIFRKILDSITGRKDYDVYFKDSRKENNTLRVSTTTRREMFPETKTKIYSISK